MICVTGSETTLEAVGDRIRSLRDAPLHEVRLDLLTAPSPDQLALLPDPERLLVTCRGADEGGCFLGSPETKQDLLRAAVRCGVRYVDLEAEAPDAAWHALRNVEPGRLVASIHRFGTTAAGELNTLVERLARRPAGTLKLAVSVGDVMFLDHLRELRVPDGRPLIRIGMGLAGVLSRIRYRDFGSPWTYATAPGTEATAPGQVTWSELAAMRARRADKLLVLLGGDQVAESPGPGVYNRLAAARGVPFYYLAVPTADPVNAVTLLTELGLEGVSVTMPHKSIVAKVAGALDRASARVAAVNTLVPARVGGWVGLNTDTQGVLGALAPYLGAYGASARVVVMGTGGAARAAVWAMVEAGHQVTVVGRRHGTAAALTARMGGTAADWSSLAHLDFEVLINATPLGARPDDVVIRHPVDWRGKTVLDMLLHPRWTRLLGEVRAGGGNAVPGTQMWIHQGAAQWKLFTGDPVTAAELAKYLDPLDTGCELAGGHP